MADCLTLLRNFNINRKEIIERDGHIIFDQAAFTKNTKTNYLEFKGTQDNTPKSYYTLETLLFLLKHASISHSFYLIKASNNKISSVHIPDRKPLLAYLNGEVDTAPGIDRNGPLELSVLPPPLKRTSVSGHEDINSKRSRMEDKNMRPQKSSKMARLTPPRATALTIEQIRGSAISTSIPEEKIYQIRTRHLAKRRQTIKIPDDLSTPGVSHADGSGDQNFLDSDVDMARDIISRERLLRNRTTILNSSGLTFTNVLTILNQIKSLEEGNAAETNSASKNSTDKSHHNSKSNQAKTYSRYDQERYKGKDETDFKIDTMGTYRGVKSVHGTDPSKSPLNPGSSKGDEDRPTSGSKRESRTPIIIVPSAITSLITLMNVKDFLQDQKFILSQDLVAHSNTEILIQRRKTDSATGKQYTVPFRVIDNVSKLRPNDWNRVVAVFVAGPKWQFKGWPGLASDGSPVELFVKTRAFHLKFIETNVEENIKKWNVTILDISRTKRHLDKVAVNLFWEMTDKCMAIKMPHGKFS